MAEQIPEQIEGKAFDYFKSVDFSSITEADQFFQKAKNRLLDVNHWDDIAGTPSATFKTKDEYGLELDRPVRQGDYIQIDIPGPGLPSAEGSDWVRVESINEESTAESRQICLTLRPSPDPTSENTDTAHFFKRLATSSILIEQKDKHIFLHYAGRNEVINTDNSSLMDNVRNFMIGLGAKMGASFPQWKALVEGLGNTH
ncbi:hypothetical protein GQF61_16375 [Sphingobacterium sp. DK4209]|uniref:Uncharacterized protein n=1 Tax=Sphingobacterium zhuxiongii TaxID=2662364 RepID=A0A5Q0QB22_9SPHI|nr:MULTISPECIES: hypothetical protein [unclassified Sphingobacterium]MVZ67432.1 hypothetical protein [Sphingobacterium sp. DK4209]QGA24868.1 hypothetical protein GFH32_00350 [Sphingobacterium sp. dk4302]